ncbi:MauE/DoxX family redox-associated membrane protein [Acuticoccus sp.]|uniref:MauE/DoxX family redox-associated membrane protein n=1 Tax=Acuticoccus sp. TaxID=1904378 RepID=UPI003B516E7F
MTIAEHSPAHARANSTDRRALLYRMVTDEHVCPFGLKSKSLLAQQGYEVEDHPLRSREAIDRFKAEHDVKTTPQAFIDGRRIGGHDDLRRHFGLDVADPSATSYAPIIAVFATAALAALAMSWAAFATPFTVRTVEFFVAFSMVVLAIQKLRDLDAFANQFLGYDLLSQRWVPYAYIYPFAEAYAGIGMIAGAPFTPFVAPVALVIGTLGSISVIKAVYVDKRDLKCACVGGNSNVPLGVISLSENVGMALLAVWMLSKSLA